MDVGLTSMDMVNLMLGVEAEFDFTIPQSEITPENFQSIKTLELMIIGQLRVKKPPDRHVTGIAVGTPREPLFPRSGAFPG